jgi:hypothetical protein
MVNDYGPIVEISNRLVDESMATRESTPGHCPNCGQSVPAANVLIEYVRDDGRPAAYAECPACADVVRPR